jgi:hypothetical protein
MMAPPNILLLGIVGSVSYGLAGPDSDVDRLGMFAAPTADFHGLYPPAETVTRTKPDVTYHEAGKWCRLALGCNPTVTELVWLPDDLYEVRTDIGDDLIRVRSALLSRRRVRDAYLGYATQQFHRFAARGDGSFSSDLRSRTAKHSRHLYRLCQCGLDLYRTGHLTVKVESPDDCRSFGERVAGGDIEHARAFLARYEAEFDAVHSPIPDRPDEAKVDRWLWLVRAAHYDPGVS